MDDLAVRKLVVNLVLGLVGAVIVVVVWIAVPDTPPGTEPDGYASYLFWPLMAVGLLSGALVPQARFAGVIGMALAGGVLVVTELEVSGDDADPLWVLSVVLPVGVAMMGAVAAETAAQVMGAEWLKVLPARRVVAAVVAVGVGTVPFWL